MVLHIFIQRLQENKYRLRAPKNCEDNGKEYAYSFNLNLSMRMMHIIRSPSFLLYVTIFFIYLPIYCSITVVIYAE